MSYYKHHIFFCLNQRDNGENACAQHGAQQAFDPQPAPGAELAASRLDDRLWAALNEALDTRQVMDLVFVVGYLAARRAAGGGCCSTPRPA